MKRFLITFAMFLLSVAAAQAAPVKLLHLCSTPDGATGVSASYMAEVASKYNVARMLERDDFNKRYSSNQSIAVHEFLYPLIQGYDSVAMECDIELGGTDQKFNLLMGRELQKNSGQTPQCILTMPLLEGLDGIQKMSKSSNNYIGIDEPPEIVFAKLLSIYDELILRYIYLISLMSSDQIKLWKI